MKRIAVATAVIMILAGLPAVSARHTSVGSDDVIGVSADETTDNPSVTDYDYEVGTMDECVDVDTDNQSMEEYERARQSDAFCGKLIYHQDSDYEVTPDKDQQYNGPIGQFDVVRTFTPMYGLAWCPPWCNSYPASDTTFQTFHDVGSEVGLTENGSEADRKDGDRYFDYGLSSPAYPAASTFIQHNVHDAWRMNGWYNQQAVYENFVGFLYDEDQQPIDQDRLDGIFAEHSDKFSADRPVQPSVCGFTPDSNIGIGAGQAGMCEVNFYYAENRGDQTSFQDGYNDKCKSPTYVCGAVQPAWHGILSCRGEYPCSHYGSGLASISTSSPVDTMRDSAAEFDYTRWHWAVAPTQSDCNGQQEPGMAFDNPDGASWNYLAHDMDVWTPVTELNDIDNTEGMDNVRDWTVEQPFNVVNDVNENASEVYDPVLENVNEAVENVTDEVPGLPPIPEAPTEVPDTSKGDRVEPNAHTDKFPNLAEDSQTLEIPRGSGDGGEVVLDPCDEFFGTNEEVHIDPWVNYVDTDNYWQDLFAVGLNSPTLYGNNDADHQDDMNAPTEGFVYFQGKVGVFADKNDNGWYNQASNNNLWDGMDSVGAYPTLWDMRLDESSGEPDTQAGCSIGFSDVPLTQEMEWAHYGPHTGLVLAVYLEEASGVTDREDVIPFPDGENIFIIESQAMHVLRNLENQRVLDFEQRMIDGLRSHEDIADNADVRYVTDILETNNAFSGQCSEATGGFDTSVSLLHNCEMGCEGDTIVTGYMGESTHPDRLLGTGGGEQGNIPKLTIDGEDFTLPSKIVEWIDVDPFDNNPDRNREESSAPPTGDE